MKNISAAWGLFLLAALIVAACGTFPSDPDCASPDVFCVGLVTNLDGLDDRSFNQGAWAGLQQAQEKLDASVKYIETVDWKDYSKNISTFAEAGYDVIVTVGYDLTNATIEAAAEYPDISFIGIDQQSEETRANFTGLAFPDDQAGFLAGALAAQMTQTGKVGGVFASDVVTYIWRFGEGYRAGAQYINPEVEVLIEYHNNASVSTSFSDPEWGASTSMSLIEQGADVIVGAGGRTGDGAVVGAVQAGALAIGFNTDQYFTLPEAQKGLLSSVIKQVTPGVFSLI
ncbi:MAG: BMP family ABC transporter substrate-binding protein, partial [Chloroflexi bacterium]